MTDVKIRCDDCKFVENCVDYGWKDCKKFTPKPSEPMTNEEYIQTCNTEQLAEWIAHQTMIALLENQNNHSLRMTYPAYWVEWLKQPHTNE